MSNDQTKQADLPLPSLTSTDNLSPIAMNERIDAMDILRGLALIGILLMNIEWFNRAIAGLGSQDTSLTGIDHAVGWFIRCFVEGKFYTLFSLLFGMGFAVMLIRAKEAKRPFGAWFSRRMLALIVFGLLHMVFLWGGDILHVYGFAGFLLLGWVTLLKRERFKIYDNPNAFFKLSVVWLSVPIFVAILAGISYGVMQDNDDLTLLWQEERQVTERVEAIHAETDVLLEKNNDEIAQQYSTDSEQLSLQTSIEQQAQAIIVQQQELAADEAEEIAAFTQGSYIKATEYRLGFTLFMLIFAIPFSFMMLLPLFILGYWLVSSGIMKNYRHHSGTFKAVAWVGISIGLVMEVSGLLVTQHPVANQVSLLLVVGETLFYIGQLVMTAGYFGLIMYLLNIGKWYNRLSIFAPMGRMALTNYISHSVILTSIFYGYAGGYFGEISRAPQMLIVFAIIMFQLFLSRWWLNNYAFGPLEWLWRCLSYKKLQPMRITAN